jgi:UPF0176 protein
MKKLLVNRVNRRELKLRLIETTEKRTTLSFYKYVQLSDPAAFRDDLFQGYQRLGVLGRIYVAQEGVNAQLSVPQTQWDAFIQFMDSYPFFRGLRLNIAVESDGKSFFALIIKVRPKIVADGIDDPNFNPSNTGKHLNAAAWNALSEDPNTIIVDMRNHYESEVGHFDKAITPDVSTFREELPLVAELLEEHKDKKILLYCTGGIRCEKASAYMKYRGFNHVFQLEGGIIEYAKQVKSLGIDNKFIGKNFVFDERLGERISPTIIANCHQCGMACDDHANCLNDYCHILFIQCPSCKTRFQNCCSDTCRDFMELPESARKSEGPKRTFNGSRFGKGVYRAWRRNRLPQLQ